VAGTGEVVELIKRSKFSIDPESPYGRGVCGQAFRNQSLAVNPDVLNSEQARPWRAAGTAWGVVACAAVPLVKKGTSVGVMMFFISQAWAQDEQIKSLLGRIAENVSFALDNFEREDERKRAQAHEQALTAQLATQTDQLRQQEGRLVEQNMRFKAALENL